MPKFASALINYLKSSIEELRKVAWPTRAETVRYSLLVIGVSLAIALVIGVLDFVLNLGVQAIVHIAS